MKKFTTLCVVLFTTITVFAIGGDKKVNSSNQKNPVVNQPSAFQHGTTTARHSNSGTHSTMVPFYSEDFAAGIPALWTSVDSAGNGVNWTWTTIGCFSQAYPGIDSLSAVGTSAANGYIMFDSDSAGQSVGGEWGTLTSNAIDCSTHPGVRLSFNEFFAKFQDAAAVLPNTARVYVSADNVNWTLVHSADAGLANNQTTANPNFVDINISSIAANQSTVYIKFSFTGDWSYFWFVDDVQLTEPLATDANLLGLFDPFNGCALSSTEPITVAIVNDGSAPISGFDATYSVNGGTPVVENITSTINPADTLLYTFTTTADLSAAGVYDILTYIAVSGDANTSNDTAGVITASGTPGHVNYHMGFESTDDFTFYSVEDADGDGATIDISATYVRTGLACLRYTLPNTASPDNWVFTSCIDFDQNDVYGLDFWFKVFDNTAVPFNVEAYLATSQNSVDATTLLAAPPTPGDTSYTNVHTTFSVPTTGTYYIAFRGFGTNVDNTTRIDDITIDLVSGIKNTDLNKAMMVYPNPSNGRIFVENTSTTEKSASVSVLNTVGQIVYTNNFSNLVKESIDLSNQPDGLYTVRISTASGVVNKTVVVSSK